MWGHVQINPASNLVKVTAALLDLILISAAFYGSIWFRFGGLDTVDEFISLYYISTPIALFLMLQQGVLTGFRYKSQREIFKSTLIAFCITGVVSSTLLYLSKIEDFSRLVFGVYFLFAAFLVLLEKFLLKKVVDSYLAQGKANMNLVLVGFGEKHAAILNELQKHPQWGLAPVLELDPRRVDIQSMIKMIRESIVDEVYISYPRGKEYHLQIDELLERLEALGLPVRVSLNFDDLQDYYEQSYCTLGSESGVLLAPYNLHPDQLIMKRALDIIGSIVGLLILGLIYPIVAACIKIESPGAVLFSQLRVGKGGREFRILKFRSMYSDAEGRKKDLEEHNIHGGLMFKMEGDPRITPVGKFLRKYSIDEIPQFWNVLLGDMSLVGTRPPTVDEVAEYEDHHHRRISIKPGITGLWQVSGRNQITDFDEIVSLDVKYIKSWNIWLDIQIILRTLLVLIPGRSSGM